MDFFSGHAKGEKFQTLPRQVQYLINRTSQNHETVLINSMSSFCLPLIWGINTLLYLSITAHNSLFGWELLLHALGGMRPWVAYMYIVRNF